MSTQGIQKLTCGGCGAEQEFETWESVNVTLNPELKERLVSGELTRFTCPGCRWSTQVRYSLLYHDMEQRFMVCLCEEATDAMSAIGKGMEEISRGYRFRLVRTRNELVEKIWIFDGGYDDRVMEFLKKTLRVQSSHTDKPLNGELLFAPSGSAEASGELHVSHVTAAGSQTLILKDEAYREVARVMGPLLPADDQESGKWLRVDQAYAVKLAERRVKSRNR